MSPTCLPSSNGFIQFIEECDDLGGPVWGKVHIFVFGLLDRFLSFTCSVVSEERPETYSLSAWLGQYTCPGPLSSFSSLMDYNVSRVNVP